MFTLTLSNYEIEARKMGNEYFAKHDGNISSCEQAALMIFAKEAASLALTPKNILDRAIANNYVFDAQREQLEEAMQSALTRLTSNKFLRSRRQGGNKFYEVRFSQK